MVVGSRREIVLLVIIGAVIGLAIGLYLAWELWPVEYVESDPSEVSREYVPDYIILIAEQHAFDGDTDRARTRLQELGISDIEETVVQLTNYYIAEGGKLSSVRALAGLSYAMGVGTSGMAIFLQTVTATPTSPATLTPVPAATIAPTSTCTDIPTATATATAVVTSELIVLPTPSATATATPTRPPSFLLTERRRICSQEAGAGKVEVNVQEVDGTGIAGVRVEISWEDDKEAFFTGLKPDRGPGYADYDLLEPDREYEITLPGGGNTATEIAAHPVTAGCPAGSVSVSWELTFVANRG